MAVCRRLSSRKPGRGTKVPQSKARASPRTPNICATRALLRTFDDDLHVAALGEFLGEIGQLRSGRNVERRLPVATGVFDVGERDDHALGEGAFAGQTTISASALLAALS